MKSNYSFSEQVAGTPVQVGSGPVDVAWLQGNNDLGSELAWLQVFDVSTSSEVTGSPKFQFPVSAGSYNEPPGSFRCKHGCFLRAVTAYDGTTAVATALTVEASY